MDLLVMDGGFMVVLAPLNREGYGFLRPVVR